MDGEFFNTPESYAPDDTIPETLKAVLKLAFANWTPGLQTDADCYRNWIEANPDLPAGHLVSADGSHKAHPTLGPIEYPWRGIVMRRMSAPHGLWHFNRAAKFARGVSGDARAKLDALIARAGGVDAMAIELARPMKREDYALVLA